MSDGGILVVSALVLAAASAFVLKGRRRSALRGHQKRSGHDTGVYPGGVYPVAADTGTRDGRGYDGTDSGRDGGGPGDPTPDAGSGGDGDSGSGSSGGFFGGGDSGGGGGDSGGGGGDGGGSSS